MHVRARILSHALSIERKATIVKRKPTPYSWGQRSDDGYQLLPTRDLHPKWLEGRLSQRLGQDVGQLHLGVDLLALKGALLQMGTEPMILDVDVFRSRRDLGRISGS